MIICVISTQNYIIKSYKYIKYIFILMEIIFSLVPLFS